MKGKCCNCGKVREIVGQYDLELNYFKLWMYTFDHKEKDMNKAFNTKIITDKWYGYIGYVPILNEIVYFLWKIFHKKNIIKLKYCKKCI